MTERYKFSEAGKEYEIYGDYGKDNVFLVTEARKAGERILTSASDVKRAGLPILKALPNVPNKDALEASLKNSFPKMTNLMPF